MEVSGTNPSVKISSLVSSRLSVITFPLRLVLRNSVFGLKAQTSLAEVFDHNSHLKSISIKNLKGDNERPLVLPANVFKNSSLQQVTLEKCVLDESACFELAKMLRRGDCELRTLNMNNVGIVEKGQGLSALNAAISTCTSLRYVTLKSMKQLKVEDTNRLLSALATNTSITTLKLDDMYLDAQHAKHLAELMSKNTYVEILSLRKNDLNPEALATIMRSGRSTNTTMKTLYLSENPIGNDGAKHVVSCMKQNTTLESLCLTNCEIWQEGCMEIARGKLSLARVSMVNLRKMQGEIVFP
jgi:Ran GTPase-activating protein (RanGAP) involved in mRNA processing and transport